MLRLVGADSFDWSDDPRTFLREILFDRSVFNLDGAVIMMSDLTWAVIEFASYLETRLIPFLYVYLFLCLARWGSWTRKLVRT